MSTRKLLALGLSAALLGGVASLIEHDVSTPQSITTEPTVHARSLPATNALPTLAASTTSIDDIIGRLDAATNEDERRQLAREMNDALVAALERDPEGTLAQLKPWMMIADPAQRSTQVALGAMVSVGTPAIQTALVGLVDARTDDHSFVRTALPTMAFLAQPTRETESAVRTWTSDVHPDRMQTMAHLTLGTMASHLAKGDVARSSAIVDDYAARLSSSKSPGERGRWLQVLGNVQTPEAARAVTTQLGAEDPSVRSRAVEALRLAPTPGVDAMLTTALGDADPRVRASAAWSLGYRKPDAVTMRAMTAKLSDEQDVAVVTKLLDVLWIRRASDRFAIVGAVERVAREHPSEKVRTYAQQLLDTAS